MSLNIEIDEEGSLMQVANDTVKKDLYFWSGVENKDELYLTVRNFYRYMYSTYCIL